MRRGAMKIVLASLALVVAASAQDVPIDVQRSTIVIHVGKAGLFSAAGHEHWVNAPISSGTIGESPAPHVEFTIETAKMTIKPDPKVDPKTQAQVQSDMEEMTLETRKFPEIAFRSSQVQRLTARQWRIEGELSLHGVTKTVRFIVESTGESYTGHTLLKQTDYGIKPVSVGGGLVKVKNEVEIDFQIFARR